MKKLKKNAVGHVEVCRLFAGENNSESKDSFVRAVAFSLPGMIQHNGMKIGSCGLENGFWKGRHSIL